jgi:hypothetical protein
VTLKEREAWLRLKLNHALGHSPNGRGSVDHHHLNVEAFFEALIKYVDARVDAALVEKYTTKRRK